jgi:pilus assembly protein Flp/PilA
MQWLRRFISDADGATAVEYAVMLAMILMALIAGVGAVGGSNGATWGNIQKNLQTVGFGS